MTDLTEGVRVGGFVAPGFEPVAETLVQSVTAGGEVGVAVAAYVDGRKVVDAWCGEAEPEQEVAWSASTLAVVYSCTKAATALCAQLLADRGLLDVDAPVAEYWPEFAAEGKRGVPVRFLLNHTVGLLAFPRYWEIVKADGRGLDRTDELVERLAATPPHWEPGTAAGYHALTYGWLVGEVVRRIDGRTLGRFFADEVAAPLGLSLWIGLPAKQHERVAPVIPPDRPTGEALEAVNRGRAAIAAGDLSSVEALTLASLFMPPEVDDPGRFLADIMNTPWVRSAEIPAGNAIATADGLARMYAPLALGGSYEGLRLVSPESITRWSTHQPTTTGQPTGFGLGYAVLLPETLALGPSERSFGHGGAGGAMGFADPEQGLAFGFVKNKMQADSATADRLIAALYGCLR
jgi:CubicO group peptidase (beta-lactamase class C family)